MNRLFLSDNKVAEFAFQILRLFTRPGGVQ
jgi:hypothetical protein